MKEKADGKGYIMTSEELIKFLKLNAVDWVIGSNQQIFKLVLVAKSNEIWLGNIATQELRLNLMGPFIFEPYKKCFTSTLGGYSFYVPSTNIDNLFIYDDALSVSLNQVNENPIYSNTVNNIKLEVTQVNDICCYTFKAVLNSIVIHEDLVILTKRDFDDITFYSSIVNDFMEEAKAHYLNHCNSYLTITAALSYHYPEITSE